LSEPLIFHLLFIFIGVQECYAVELMFMIFLIVIVKCANNDKQDHPEYASVQSEKSKKSVIY